MPLWLHLVLFDAIVVAPIEPLGPAYGYQQTHPNFLIMI